MMRQGLVEEAHTLFSKLHASFCFFFNLFHTRCIRMAPLLIQIRYVVAGAVEGEVDLKNACQLSSSTMPPSSRRHFEQRAANKACRRRGTTNRRQPAQTITTPVV